MEAYLDDIREDIANYALVIRNESTRPEKENEGKKRRGSKSSRAKSVNVTVSIGLSDSRASKNPDVVRGFADEALYKAKAAGRNQIKIKTD